MIGVVHEPCGIVFFERGLVCFFSDKTRVAKRLEKIERVGSKPVGARCGVIQSGDFHCSLHSVIVFKCRGSCIITCGKRAADVGYDIVGINIAEIIRYAEAAVDNLKDGSKQQIPHVCFAEKRFDSRFQKFFSTVPNNIGCRLLQWFKLGVKLRRHHCFHFFRNTADKFGGIDINLVHYRERG